MCHSYWFFQFRFSITGEITQRVGLTNWIHRNQRSYPLSNLTNIFRDTMITRHRLSVEKSVTVTAVPRPCLASIRMHAAPDFNIWGGLWVMHMECDFHKRELIQLRNISSLFSANCRACVILSRKSCLVNAYVPGLCAVSSLDRPSPSC